MGFISNLFARAEPALTEATSGDAAAISALHGASFRRGWNEQEVETLLTDRHVLAHRAMTGSKMAGFIMSRLVEDEAEILTVAVARESRRRGVGRALLEEAMRHAYREGAERMYLEVEDTNRAAIALYRWAEFHETGRRAGYYREGRTAPGGALVMLRQLR